jgi:signal transduction histidine kinase
MILTIVLLSFWVVRRFTAPLDAFTEAASRLGRNVNAPALPESGPREVRRAARAFNEMQDRIRRFVHDRTQMIAAISHDLRTPITRLRLRADEVGDEEQQTKMLKDLEEMEEMIAAVLSFAREDGEAEPQSRLDLGALLQSICDDMADAGRAVTMEDAPGVLFTGQRMALKRAFTNLIDNAVKYGKCARARLLDSSECITVQIDDEGPGIPESEHEKVFASFYRLEQSRSRETGGTGLGLAFTRTIIRRHGGDIALHNRAEGGLRVVVTLPR